MQNFQATIFTRETVVWIDWVDDLVKTHPMIQALTFSYSFSIPLSIGWYIFG